jgi:hypothetical protein
MKKFIVTTTINKPTEALLKFIDKEGWTTIVVGDLKTPHSDYENLNCIYLDPNSQKDKYKTLSDSIGWNCIQRRNIGFVEAYNLGADIIATVDDDNIPYSNWGEDILINKKVSCNVYDCSPSNVFDPLSTTNNKHLWHRGYPIQLLKERSSVYKNTEYREFLVQADLWNGDPDIDAIARLAFSPDVIYDTIKPFCCDAPSPFNSQNTFLSREVIPYYMMIPYIGRFDDIWASYIMQYYYPKSVVYNCATVYQERNDQDLIKNLEDEIFGYRHTLDLLNNLSDWRSFLPDQSKKFVDEYQKCFKN